MLRHSKVRKPRVLSAFSVVAACHVWPRREAIVRLNFQIDGNHAAFCHYDDMQTQFALSLHTRGMLYYYVPLTKNTRLTVHHSRNTK